MRAPAQLHISEISFERPDRTILSNVSLTVGPGDRIGLTGPNGVGKSTLLAIAAGVLEPTGGRVAVVPAEATVGLLRQELEAGPDETARQLIERSLGIADAAEELERATAALAGSDGVAATAGRYDRALQRWLDLGGATIDERLPPTLADLGLDPAKADQLVATLSGGEQGRVGLATIELAQFDVLLLDEPTNNLDLAGLDRLERLLRTTSTPYVLVSHDRRFLERTVNAVVELDGHHGTAQRFAGGWQSFIAERAIARDHEQRRFDDYAEKRGVLLDRARTERSWADKGVRRAVKNPRDNDKIQRNNAIEKSENLAAKARRTERAMERLDEVDKPWEPWRLQFEFGAATRSGDVVVELVDAVIERGDFRLGPVSIEVRSGDRLHIAGPNGAGKTTLLAAMLGELPLSGGSRRLGPAVTVGRLEQERDIGEMNGSVLDAIAELTGATVVECRSTLAKFGLAADHVQRAARDLSPGERTRSLLAAFQIRGVNTVVLDEPTNHLDVEAIEQLESALEQFDGTLIVISHDRALLENVETNTRFEL